MAPKIAVLAAGAIGGEIGGMLTKAGHDVVLIDQWPAHVEAMKAHGLRITRGARRTNPEAEYVVPVRAYHLYEVCTLRQQFDIVFLACKSYDTCWLVQLMEPYLKPDGVVVSVQNSLNDEWIVPIVGYTRDIGCVLTAGGELVKPGHVWPNHRPEDLHYTLGELHGRITPRLERVVKIMSDAGKTDVTTNIWGAKWYKLMYNAMSCAHSALADSYKMPWELMDAPNFLPICAQLGKEAMRVGVTLGYNMEPLHGLTAEDLLGSADEVMERLMRAQSRGARPGASTMVQQDIWKGRPSEVGGYLNGLVVRKGQQAKVSTPVNEAVTELVLRLERGELRPDVSNLKLVKLPRGQ